MDGLLSIGEFSERCGLSPKMLRSYGTAGLLRPAAVDQYSGYRYYAADQLRQAELIALLRQAEITVSDIAAFLNHPDPGVLDRWQHDLASESVARRSALARARAAITADHGFPTDQRHKSRRGSEMGVNIIGSGSATDIGRRDINQDGVLVTDDLFAVADGFGQGGEMASQVALLTLSSEFSADRSIAGLLAACQDANRGVWRRANAQNDIATMGTTLTAVANTADIGVVMVHVGDSRLYRVRQGRLSQLTLDHTVVDDLVRAGELNERDAESHPHRQVLLRALGVAPVVDLDYGGVSLQPGDRLLLCTDGLFRTLSVDDIRAALRSGAEAQRAADDLVSSAVCRSAEDNVTAVILSA